MREHFKKLADDLKKRHGELHPDYRYSPRRPNEIARRTKLNANSVNFIRSNPRGMQRANNATDGFIWDLDTQFLEILDDYHLIRGPQSVAPPAYAVNDNFGELVSDQVERITAREVQFTPLSGNEFAPGFDMESLLNLPGASETNPQ